MADSITRLANLITGLHIALFKGISLIRSGTDCPLADEDILYTPPIYLIETKCTRVSPECKIVDFLEVNTKNLRKIRDSLTSEPAFSNLHDLLGKVIGNENIAKGRNCQKLGDIIICLNSPTGYTVYNTNIKDFAIVCKSLGKPFIGIKYSPNER